DSGMAWPSSRSSIGLKSNVSNCDGPPDMYRKITRLTRGRTWNGSITPCDCQGKGRRSSSGAPSRSFGSRSEARAIDPRPREVRPRKVRRVGWERKGSRALSFIGSVPGDRLVEVQEGAGDGGPRGQLGGRGGRRGVGRGLADA